MITKRKLFISFILVGVGSIFLICLTSCKKEAEPTKPTVATNSETTEQTLCPVMNAPINKELYTEYKGKKVYFCCPDCKEKFETEPEKYVDKLPQFK